LSGRAFLGVNLWIAVMTKQLSTPSASWPIVTLYVKTENINVVVIVVGRVEIVLRHYLTCFHSTGPVVQI
jgi:hypothetical protein